MKLPYSSATSGQRAMEEIQKILQRFGCSSFGHMMRYEDAELVVQFEFHGTPVSIKANLNGYAAAWLRENPFNAWTRVSKIEHERKAKAIAAIAVYSILRDWIKGQVTAVDTGILSFEGAFLGQILLPSGKTVLEHAKSQKLLSSPPDEKVVNMGGRK